MSRWNRGPAAIFLAASVGLLLAGRAGVVTAAQELPEVSADGLHRMKNTKVRIVYAKPGASLKPYGRVKILDCFVDFKKNWQREYNLEEVGLSGRVTDKDAEAIKQRLSAEFEKVFTERLTKHGHQVVEDAGPDVLLLRPALLNVDVTAPEPRSAGRSSTYIRSAGSMTLFLELYDSATGTLLARIIDPQADDPGFATEASRGSNRLAADRILRRWADLLASNLGEVKRQSNGD